MSCTLFSTFLDIYVHLVARYSIIRKPKKTRFAPAEFGQKRPKKHVFSWMNAVFLRFFHFFSNDQTCNFEIGGYFALGLSMSFFGFSWSSNPMTFLKSRYRDLMTIRTPSRLPKSYFFEVHGQFLKIDVRWQNPRILTFGHRTSESKISGFQDSQNLTFWDSDVRK